MPTVRKATARDAAIVGRLLDQFNREFDTYTPGADFLAQRLERLIAANETHCFLATTERSSDALGVAVLRFRPSLWSDTLDAYLEELYVEPNRRGLGLGRALLQAALDDARTTGAGNIQLGTSEQDRAARALYESEGFINREGGSNGPVMFCYELDL